MSVLEALAIVGAGLVAGTINTIVGSGSLITFPTLLAFGFPPVVANVSNTVGLVPGIAQRRHRLPVGAAWPAAAPGRAGRASVCGRHRRGRAAAGPARQRLPPRGAGAHPGRVRRWWRCSPGCRRAWHGGRTAASTAGPVLFGSVFLTGVYGGYFGAAQGVILMSLLGIFLSEHLQRAQRDQERARLARERRRRAACSSPSPTWRGRRPASSRPARWSGDRSGGMLGRRLPASLLRGIIVMVGVIAAIALLV